jgi:hypothetical protein
VATFVPAVAAASARARPIAPSLSGAGDHQGQSEDGEHYRLVRAAEEEPADAGVEAQGRKQDQRDRSEGSEPRQDGGHDRVAR